MRPRPPEGTAQDDAGAEDPSNGERGDPGARVHPEPEPWPLRACSRRHASVPVGHRIRRTQTGHLISTGNRSRLSMACDRTTQQSPTERMVWFNGWTGRALWRYSETD